MIIKLYELVLHGSSFVFDEFNRFMADFIINGLLRVNLVINKVLPCREIMDKLAY